MVHSRESEQFNTLKCTKFATISSNGFYVVKSICKDITVPPHDSRSELAILKKLSQGNEHTVKLLGYECEEEYLKLFLPLYDMDLDEYMRSCYRPPKKRSKRFNPYLSFTGAQDLEDQPQVCENQFDVNKHAHDFFLQLSSALQFIHSQGIIHRDVKPQNVLLNRTEEPRLVLTDFGISYDTLDPIQLQREDPNAKITDVSTSIYKAPELLFGVKNYKFAVDIWALLILISQWFQHEANLSFSILPAMVDDGSGQLEDGETGSDIRLIFSIFSNLGIPAITQWTEVEKYGSSEAFQGMFGSNGDGNYLLNKHRDDQLQTIHKLMPRLNEIQDNSTKSLIENCILGMITFDSCRRWSSKQIVHELTKPSL
ncbi:cyclin-dependent kinase-activating kinase [Zygosaccharomyces mellis]|uniref:Cyclin-dependent kinase-activating kinase n=1 Tax=Zygosaccharomyces mellis TaxID=42258 RepID=A0A4C2EBJ9_9SACH|nr:cyclin-dependent kinase-activating kinase [Zygosaccharomyces mellis]